MSIQRISERIDKDRLQTLSNSLLQSDIGFVTNWCCDPIGPVNRNFVTGGVYRISGMTDIGEGVSRSWSFILKVVNADPKRDDPAHYNYWRREIMVYDSELLRNLPANITTPECFAIDEKDDGSVWLWLEDMTHEPRQWEWKDYAFVTEKLGEFQSAYLLGKPLPEFQWVNRQWMRSWINECYLYRYVPDKKNKEILLADKRVAAIINQFTLLEASISDWLIALENLPKTFAHQDFYEQNIMLNIDQQQEGKLTLIDWQFASISGIGEDLGRFLGLSVSRGQVPIEQFKEYRELFMSSYIKGIRRAGWLGDENLPRLGCLAAFALRSIWEVPKLLKKLEQDPDSPESLQLMFITEQQMEAAIEVERLRMNSMLSKG
ncbi:phosphotransferase [Paenibacillus sp. Soil522]|uniref:phosphotransferase n=1 Tax=Paenibacillus sp. Soil522 TaxID=1736388 RepID=UPI0006F2CEA9|nr:phosphotransferase [Paenibacillus sp. Soil522]KRE30264.1 aminoglycoside phosphotransferase [Paenibacillus sp. Soil522]